MPSWTDIWCYRMHIIIIWYNEIQSPQLHLYFYSLFMQLRFFNFCWLHFSTIISKLVTIYFIINYTLQFVYINNSIKINFTFEFESNTLFVFKTKSDLLFEIRLIEYNDLESTFIWWIIIIITIECWNIYIFFILAKLIKIYT